MKNLYTLLLLLYKYIMPLSNVHEGFCYYIYLHKHGTSGSPFIVRYSDYSRDIELSLISDIRFSFYANKGDKLRFKIYRIKPRDTLFNTNAYIIEKRKTLTPVIKFSLVIDEPNNNLIKKNYDNFRVSFNAYSGNDDNTYYISHPQIHINKSLLK